MVGVFSILFLLSVVGLVWGLVAPKHLAARARISKPVTRKHFGLGFGALIILSSLLTSAAAPPQPISVRNAGAKTAAPKAIQEPAKKADVVTTEEATETKPIAFESKTQNDATLAKGLTKTIQTGQNGIETLTYKITYVNGKQANKTLVSTTTTTPPTTQITAIGTYVAPAPAPTPSPRPIAASAPNCSNGTYVNSAGNTVCRPDPSPTVPTGATAQCSDGTYSFSQNHRGTCSHHGGVARWL